jgi:peptidoglycan/LPS O-acetylase OafA/YrhL
LNPSPNGNSFYIHYSPTHLRFDSLLIGVLVSFYYSFHREELARVIRKYKNYLSPISLACLTPIMFQDHTKPFMYTIGFTLVALGFGILLLMVIHSDNSKKAGVILRAGAWLGRSSYAFYLAQGPILVLTGYFLNLAGGSLPVWATMAVTFVAFVVNVVVATLLTAFIDMPFLKLRDRLFPSNGRVRTVAPAVSTKVVNVPDLVAVPVF